MDVKTSMKMSWESPIYNGPTFDLLKMDVLTVEYIVIDVKVEAYLAGTCWCRIQIFSLMSGFGGHCCDGFIG